MFEDADVAEVLAVEPDDQRVAGLTPLGVGHGRGVEMEGFLWIGDETEKQ